jgi:hypothetical protein
MELAGLWLLRNKLRPITKTGLRQKKNTLAIKGIQVTIISKCNPGFVLRRIFGPKRDEVTGGFRKLHNEELHNLYSSPSLIRMIKSRKMRWAGHVARMRAKRNTYRILVGNSEGKRPLGRPRHRWVDNIKMDLREIGWDGMGWYELDRSGSG